MVAVVVVVVVKFWRRFGVPPKNNLGKQWGAQMMDEMGVSPKKQ